MRKSLEFKVITYDKRTVPASIHAEASETFFTDHLDSTSASVTKREETEITSWLLTHQLAKPLILGEITPRYNNPCIRFGVQHPIITTPNKKPGDIDVLVWDPPNPHQAVAIECKRVKVTAIDTDQDTVNKIQGIGGGVAQANAMKELGFFSNYLAIFILVDGRLRTEYNVVHRGASDQTFHQIYEFPYRGQLSPDVGILFVEIIQPTGKVVDTMGYIGVALDRASVHGPQPTSLTNKILAMT